MLCRKDEPLIGVAAGHGACGGLERVAVSQARLVITAVVVEGRTQGEVAAAYGVSKGWVSKLLARYRAEGQAAFEPRSRRPRTSPVLTEAWLCKAPKALTREFRLTK
jgi:hypothetical protein